MLFSTNDSFLTNGWFWLGLLICAVLSLKR